MKATNNRMAGLITASALAIGLAAIAQPAMAGISASKHNLGSNNTSGNHVSDTAEICVFCHTPHGSNTLMIAAPLWNKRITSAAYSSYTSLNSATFDAVQNGPGDVSLACLSCHDGTQAMDNIINAPGSGGYNSTGGGVSGLVYTWTAVQGKVSAEGFLQNSTTGANIPMLDTDLRNDHPIGINYCGAASNTALITAVGNCADKDFNSGIGGGGSKAWIDTPGGTTGGAFEKSDLPLYNYSGGVGIRVECATCHDPHQDPSTVATFLRVANSGSKVCLTCHNK